MEGLGKECEIVTNPQASPHPSHHSDATSPSRLLYDYSVPFLISRILKPVIPDVPFSLSGNDIYTFSSLYEIFRSDDNCRIHKNEFLQRGKDIMNPSSD